MPGCKVGCKNEVPTLVGGGIGWVSVDDAVAVIVVGGVCVEKLPVPIGVETICGNHTPSSLNQSSLIHNDNECWNKTNSCMNVIYLTSV